MSPSWLRVVIIGGALVVVGLSAFGTYSVVNEGNGEPEAQLAEPTETTAPDLPRYTDEEVIAKIRDYQFDVTREGGTKARWTVTDMTGTVVSFAGLNCEALGPWAWELMQQGQAQLCTQVQESATYEGNGRWTVVLAFGTTKNEPVANRFDARISFREDTGEIIPLNVAAQNLMGRGQ
jgi:hypothetical protein